MDPYNLFYFQNYYNWLQNPSRINGSSLDFRQLAPHNLAYQQTHQGGGDVQLHFSNQNINPSKPLSPPNKSLRDAFVPLKQIRSSTRTAYSERANARNSDLPSVRIPAKVEPPVKQSLPSYEELNYLNWPYGSSMDKYQLFDNFNFAVPQRAKIRPLPAGLSSEEHEAINEEYEMMREDFARNGALVKASESNRSFYSSTLSLSTFSDSAPSHSYGEFDFPPLQMTKFSDSRWSLSSSDNTSLPVQPWNSTSLDYSSCNKLKTRSKKKTENHCVFCEMNGESDLICSSHKMKDSEGKVLCPRLRHTKCSTCGATGEKAHEIGKCPRRHRKTLKTPRRFNKHQ